MEYHRRVIEDFRRNEINVYEFLFDEAEKRLGHLGTGDKLRLKQKFHLAIDERLQNDPTFYTNRDFGVECSAADDMQINRVALSVIDDFV